jgi:hypothetical protein
MAGYYAKKPPTRAAAKKMGVIRGVTPGYPLAAAPTAAPVVDATTTGYDPASVTPPVVPGDLTWDEAKNAYGRWVDPDYEALARGDPLYGPEHQRIIGEIAAAGRQRGAAIQAALYRWGGALPPEALANLGGDWMRDFGGDITPEAQAAAAANPYSVLATAGRQKGTDIADLEASLAGRGMIWSGALTGGTQAAENRYGAALAQGATGPGGLFEALTGAGTQYAGTYGTLTGQERAALGEAMGRSQTLYKPTWHEWDPVTGTYR